MGEVTEIGWTDHTINLWWGCQEVAPECEDCYARTFAKRVGKADAWEGRRFIVNIAFGHLDNWQRKAEKKSVRETVFAMSMGDLFEKEHQLSKWVKGGKEERELIDESIESRRREFFDSITDGRWDNLVFLCLTKRPGNILQSVPAEWREPGGWPTNVWTGTSVGSRGSLPQIKRLLDSPGKHFVSFEPLLEQLGSFDIDGIDWAIVGVESRGASVGRLPDDSAQAWNDAAGELVDQFRAEKIPTYVKQIPIEGKVSTKIDRSWDPRLQFQDFPDWSHTPRPLNHPAVA